MSDRAWVSGAPGDGDEGAPLGDRSTSDGRGLDPRIDVLLVEDNRGDAVLVETYVAPMGARLRTVTTLGEALAVAREVAFDVILLDLGLPDASGLETIGAVRGRVLDTPIIVLTGHDHDLGESAIAAGAQDYLPKNGLSQLVLTRTIRHALERARAERERASLQLQLSHALKLEAIGRLAGGVAHDFNNLLEVVLIYAGLIRERAEPGSDVGDYADTIARSATRAAELTRQLLMFSRRHAGRPERTDVNHLVTDLDRVLRRTLGADIELVTLVAPEPAVVHIDRGQLEQAVMNLVVNARDAMPDGGKLALRVALESGASGSEVVLRVTDNGCGMTPEVAARAFEPFFTTKDAGEGTGLGLASCHGLISDAGGTIGVDSQPEVGTTFTIRLPGAEGGVTASTVIANPVEELRGVERVLLVEDEPVVRRAVAFMLAESGFDVVVAANGDEAVRRWDEHEGEFDVVVTDMVMPRLGGRELAERIRERDDSARFVFMTGYAGSALLGTDRVLEKPFTKHALLAQVRARLEDDE